MQTDTFENKNDFLGVMMHCLKNVPMRAERHLFWNLRFIRCQKHVYILQAEALDKSALPHAWPGLQPEAGNILYVVRLATKNFKWVSGQKPACNIIKSKTNLSQHHNTCSWEKKNRVKRQFWFVSLHQVFQVDKTYFIINTQRNR